MTPTETSHPFRSTPSPEPSAPSGTRATSPAPGKDPLGPALEALELHRPEETVALARERLQANPADAFALAVLGVALCQMGQAAAALQALERAHYLNPHDARILYNYGLVLEAAGRPTAARIRFFAALKLSPQYALAREHLLRLQAAPSGDVEAKQTAPPPPSPTLERLREDEFHSSWTEGVLPKDLSASVGRAGAVSHTPAPLPFTPTPSTASPPTKTLAIEPGTLPTTDSATAASLVGNRNDREGRRVVGSLVMVQVLAFGLLAGAVAYTALRPTSSPSGTSAALADSTPAAGRAAGPRRRVTAAEAGPGGISYRQARMANVDLQDKSLANADFEEADLSCSRLVRADLQGASFIHASLPGADLRNARLTRANLLGVLLRDADLRGADLRSAYLKAAELSYANLSAAWLEKATLTHAELRQSILTGAQLPGASLRSANLYRANLQSANLKGADLNDADLSGADLRGANLDSATLTGARYDPETRWPEKFQPAERGAKRIVAAPR